MIKAVIRREPGGIPMLVLGLSAENLERLPQDRPILITVEQMRELGMPEMAIVILGGETEDELVADVHKLTGGHRGQP